MKPFSEWLSSQIEKSNRDQRETAKKLCVSQSTISFWCNGHQKPSLKRLKDIAKLYDVDVSELLRRL